MKKTPIFKGISTALATPFYPDGTLDLESFKSLVNMQCSSACQALTVCGTTGEAPTLSTLEHNKLVSAAVDISNGTLPVIAGCGSNDIRHALELTCSACDAGCNAILVVSPYYNKGNDEGLIRFFTIIADASSVPVILYNVPSRTGQSIPLSVLRELSKHERIVAVKDASQNIKDSLLILSELSNDLDIYCGNDDLILPMLSLGAVGGISVLSNIIPNNMNEICTEYFSGNTEKSRRIFFEILPLAKALFCEVNPIPLKYAMSLLSLCSPTTRLPLALPTSEHQELIRSALISTDLLSLSE